MNVCWRALVLMALLPLAGLGVCQSRAAAQLTPAESRQALDAAMKAAATFQLPPGLSRQQIGTLDRVIASLKRGNNPEALKVWGEFVNSIQPTSEGRFGNIMETLYWVLRESIVDNNKDRKYWLSKLAGYNKLGQQLSQYLLDLGAASSEIATRGGTKRIRAHTISGSGEGLSVSPGEERPMNLPEARAETARARKASSDLDFVIGQAQAMLKQDMAKDTEVLRKLLQTLKEFEDAMKKKLGEQQGRRPPPR